MDSRDCIDGTVLFKNTPVKKLGGGTVDLGQRKRKYSKKGWLNNSRRKSSHTNSFIQRGMDYRLRSVYACPPIKRYSFINLKFFYKV